MLLARCSWQSQFAVIRYCLRDIIGSLGLQFSDVVCEKQLAVSGCSFQMLFAGSSWQNVSLNINE